MTLKLLSNKTSIGLRHPGFSEGLPKEAPTQKVPATNETKLSTSEEAVKVCLIWLVLASNLRAVALAGYLFGNESKAKMVNEGGGRDHWAI